MITVELPGSLLVYRDLPSNLPRSPFNSRLYQRLPLSYRPLPICLVTEQVYCQIADDFHYRPDFAISVVLLRLSSFLNLVDTISTFSPYVSPPFYCLPSSVILALPYFPLYPRDTLHIATITAILPRLQSKNRVYRRTKYYRHITAITGQVRLFLSLYCV